MAERRTVVVFGLEDSLGAAVARSLLHSGLFQVRLAVRAPGCQAASQLESLGAQVAVCPGGEAEGAAAALAGAWGCFLLTQTDFQDPEALKAELRYGQTVAAACAAAHVQHVVFCTEMHTQRVHGIQARHLVAKAEVEEALRSAGLPLTCLMVPVRYQHLLTTLRPLPSSSPGTFQLAIPMGTTPLALIGEDDVGAVVVKIFQDSKSFLGKILSLCGDKLTIREMAATLTRHLKPYNFKDMQVTVNEYRQTGLPWALDWANMFYFFQRVDQRYNIDLTRQLHPSLQSLDAWVQANAPLLQQALQ